MSLQERLSPLFFEHLNSDELRSLVDKYNSLHQSSDMVLVSIEFFMIEKVRNIGFT